MIQTAEIHQHHALTNNLNTAKCFKIKLLNSFGHKCSTVHFPLVWVNTIIASPSRYIHKITQNLQHTRHNPFQRLYPVDPSKGSIERQTLEFMRTAHDTRNIIWLRLKLQRSSTGEDVLRRSSRKIELAERKITVVVITYKRSGFANCRPASVIFILTAVVSDPRFRQQLRPTIVSYYVAFTTTTVLLPSTKYVRSHVTSFSYAHTKSNANTTKCVLIILRMITRTGRNERVSFVEVLLPSDTSS